ncbi:MAG: hypothetical protein M3Y26_04900 [Actinomycetota bacterium]|nr:hypothetical protein [Actinomycetota bacterium]
MTDGPARTGLEHVSLQSVDDLCARLGLSFDEIRVVSAESITWPDRSLGCPHPGMVYPQVMVDGAKVVLEANGHRYAYHSGGGRGPFLCERGSGEVGGRPPGAPSSGRR